MIKVFINNIEVPYEDKISLNRAFNEELDSATIIIPNSPNLRIKRLDEALIVNYNEETNTQETIAYLLVGNIVKEYVTFEKPFRFDYTLSLISPTIKLQSIILPNLSITQPLESKRSIYDEILRIKRVYAKDYTISQHLKALTETIVCPELQWNRKTFFEIMNDLLINVPAVVTVLQHNVIDCIELNPTYEEINHGIINNIVEVSKMDEYCSEIEIAAENVVENKPNIHSVRGISPRADDYIMTTSNCKLVLDKPIYSISKIECYCNGYPYGIQVKKNGVISRVINFPDALDITPYVVEDSVYITKFPSNKKFDVINEDVTSYKRAFLSYHQGGDTIDNLSFTEENIIGWNVGQIALQVVLEQAALEVAKSQLLEGETIDKFGPLGTLDPRLALFNITYTSQTGLRFRVEKQNAEQLNHRLLIDNQSNSYISASALWKAEKENIKRIGNNELTISATCGLYNMPSYKTKFYKYVLTQSEAILTNQFVEWQGHFTKDFVRKNLYTGLKSKARWTSIAKADEALNRQELIKYEFIASTIEESEFYGEDFLFSLFRFFGQDKDLLRVYFSTSNSEPNETGWNAINGWFKIAPSVYVLGNNVIASISTKDNYSVGMQVQSEIETAFALNQCKYVDDNGEFKTLALILRLNYTDKPLSQESLEDSRNLPQTLEMDISQRDEFLVMKDNREIYGVDIQMEFKGKDGVIIYPELLRQSHFSIGNKGQNFYFFTNNRPLTEADEILDLNNIERLEFNLDNVTSKGITQPNFASQDFACWGVLYDDGNYYHPLIVCNSQAKNIYFNKGERKLC